MQTDIRQLAESDLPALADAFPSRKTPDDPQARWRRLLAENRDGRRVTLVAWSDAGSDGAAAVGYTNVIWSSTYPPFRASGIPEINNMVVVEPLRGRGIGTALIRACEAAAAAAGHAVIGIGVGLTEHYARARRLYPHLGYEFDGRGVYTNDWGSAEYLTKPLPAVAKRRPGGVE